MANAGGELSRAMQRQSRKVEAGGVVQVVRDAISKGPGAAARSGSAPGGTRTHDVAHGSDATTSNSIGDRISGSSSAVRTCSGSAANRSGSLPSDLARTTTGSSNATSGGQVQSVGRGRTSALTSTLPRDRSVSEASSLGGQSDATSCSGLSRGRNEGWLSKRSSGTMARWQRRYWTLEGYKLHYHLKCGGPVKRSFDLRRVQQVSIAEGLPRELELDFGFRVWRLRADSQASASRWLQLFNTARQISGGSPMHGTTADFSDDDSSASTCSTADSASAHNEFRTAMQRQQERKAEGEDGQTRIVQVARPESRGLSPDTFRSGWSRPVHVEPPLGSVTSSRSSSAPGSKRHTGDKECLSIATGGNPLPVDGGSRMTRSGSLPPSAGLASSSGVGGSSDAASSAHGQIQRRSALPTHELGKSSTLSSSGPHHEGWLYKLSGGNMARWQRRYFTLDGCRLQYGGQRGGSTRRSFDLRRMQHVCIAGNNPTELELDYGFRIWRLRAETEECAQQWLRLLDASRRATGDAFADSIDAAQWEDGSDDESAGSVSSRSSAVSLTDHSAKMEHSPRFGGDDEPSSCSPTSRSMSPGDSTSGLSMTLACGAPVNASRRSSNRSRTPKGQPHAAFGVTGQLSPEVPEFRPIADRLEIDPDVLDRRFEAWIADAEAKSMRHGLAAALDGLWVHLGAPEQFRKGHAVDAALATLQSFRPDPMAFCEAVEGVLGEYLARMRRHLERWVRECDPSADEIADVLTWFLFEAMPSLARFEAGAQLLSAKPLVSWHDAAGSLEQLLFAEWENRSCDEICERCSQVYACHGETHIEAHQGSARASAVLEILRAAIRQCDTWPGHPIARDRVASVLIAALNAVLRHFRSFARSLLASSALGGSEGSAKHRIGKMIRKFGSGSLEEHGVSVGTLRTAIAATATEAAELARFCSDTTKTQSTLAAHDMCSEVLGAFTGAFDREGSALCTVLAEAHFVEAHRQTLKEIGTSLRASQSALSGPCSAATEFLREVFEHDSPACGGLACAAIIKVIVSKWIRAFQKCQPRLSACPTLPDVISADEVSLEQLADRWGAKALWKSNLASDPIQTLREVRSLLADHSTADIVDMGAARLEVLLGREQGAAAASAVRLAIAR